MKELEKNTVIIHSVSDKLTFLLTDIYDKVKLNRSNLLKDYTISKQLTSILDKNELVQLMEYLRGKGVFIFMNRVSDALRYTVGSTVNDYPSFYLRIDENRVRDLLGLTKNRPSLKGVLLDPVESVLYVNGNEIILGRGGSRMHRSIQYWICSCCLKKPDKRVSESIILNRYLPDYDITAHGRAVRDACKGLAQKIHDETGIEKLFEYSAGYAIYHSHKINI